MEQTQSHEIMELSLERTIKTKLIQSNVTEQVLVALKEKYGGMKLTSLNDKECYLELKVAARECAKVRTLTVKICKEGREEAVKVQKQWIATEKDIVSQIAMVEDALDAEIKKFDDEVERLATEEKNRQEEAYINRQVLLTKMGATYINGCFILGEVDFEAKLIKCSSQDVWEEAVLPKFQAEYQKIEAVKIEEQRLKDESLKELKIQKEELAKNLAELKKQQDEMQRQKNEAESLERNRIHELQNKRLEILLPHNPHSHNISVNNLWSLSEEDFAITFSNIKEANEKMQAEKQKKIEEAAIKSEQDRQAKLKIEMEQEKLIAEQKKKDELDAASDKRKWQEFTSQLKEVITFDMRSGQYRKRMQIAKEKIEEILSL